MAINLKNLFRKNREEQQSDPTGQYSGGKRVNTLPFFVFITLLLVVAGAFIFYLTASSTSQGKGTARAVRQQAGRSLPPVASPTSFRRKVTEF